MKRFLHLGLVFFTFFSCKNADKNLDSKSYKAEKQSLFEKEHKNPKSFLIVSGTDRRNIWGKTVYKGTITNSASVCSYKDVRVKLLYFKDGILVSNHEEQFDETFAPGGEKEFKAKYRTPRGTDSVAASIMSATSLGE